VFPAVLRLRAAAGRCQQHALQVSNTVDAHHGFYFADCLIHTVKPLQWELTAQGCRPWLHSSWSAQCICRTSQYAFC
jgi:hypothetical protein